MKLNLQTKSSFAAIIYNTIFSKNFAKKLTTNITLLGNEMGKYNILSNEVVVQGFYIGI